MAARLARLRTEGHDVVVVVSAMGDTTDELLALATQITSNPQRRELDMLLTAGERISMALLSMALIDMGCPAISFTGSQSGVITDSGHGQARITDVKPIRIRQELDKGRVVIVAGFQGVSPEKEVTTLGRGGSDTSAVALAVAFHAAECDIYTDVDGVFTADPRVVSEARHIPHLDFDTMLEFSSRGAGVINSRAVELARHHGMPIVLLNSLKEAPGTRVDAEVSMERSGIAGVTANDRVVEIHVGHLKLRPETVAGFMRRLAGIGLNMSGLHQFEDGPGTVGLTFIVPESLENNELFRKLDALVAEHGGSVRRDESAGAVSVVGAGVINTAEVAAKSLECLSRAGIAPAAFLSGTLSMTFIVPRDKVADAVKALHGDLVG